MQKFIVKGGHTLSGEITVAGNKNAALKFLPACVLIPGEITLTNLPNIQAISVMGTLLSAIGAKVDFSRDGHTARINAEKIKTTKLPTELVTKERASHLLAGPLLARFGSVELHHPGGDVIGERPLDILLDGFKALGATVKEGDRSYKISAKKLTGGKFVFRRVTWTVTENLILAATLAHGTTELINAALEPEIIALADFLNAHGARIEGAGSPTIKIHGVRALKKNGSHISIMPDRFETGTLACLAAATNSEIKIKKCSPSDMEVFLKTLELIGVRMVREKNTLTIKKRSKPLQATEIVTHEYPGLSTDYQSPLTVLLTQTNGLSLVHETIWEGRLFYTDKLKQMGAKIIMADPHRVIINGPTKLRGRKIISPDIRAGIALVIAGLVAQGTTTIGNIYQIDRGYEKIDKRLRALGADIQRVETDYF